MEVNVVKVAEDLDFTNFRNLCDNHNGWTSTYKSKFTRVWTMPSPYTNFKIFKIQAEFSDVPASVVYDVLHDADYRSMWDKYMYKSKDLGPINPNNDVSYYALNSPPPFKNRDFVLQRSWLQTNEDMIIINHSVCHEDYPPFPDLVRATSYLTGYLVRPLSRQSCLCVYISHVDPRGALPSWAVNKISRVISPKVLKKLHSACLAYPSWKACSPCAGFKPWLYPEQLATQRLDLSKCRPQHYAPQPIVDESRLRSASPMEGEPDD